MRKRLSFCLALVAAPLAVASNTTTLNQAQRSQLIIDSREGMQCDRIKGHCQAEGHIVVTKGPYKMTSQRADVYTRKVNDSKTEIQRVEAQDDVRFFGPENEAAVSQKAVYDADQQNIRLTPIAGQKVTLWKDNYIIFSNRLDIKLQDGQTTDTRIQDVIAQGDVVLSSPDELVKADKAIYNPNKGYIYVYGNVTIDREQGQTQGSYAEVNLDTKRIKMIKRPGVKTDKDVRVFIYPDKSKGLSGRGKKQS